MDNEHVVSPQVGGHEPETVVMDNGNIFHFWVIGVTPLSQRKLTDDVASLVQ